MNKRSNFKRKKFFNKVVHWKKEVWYDKQNNPIGTVLVKRDKGQIIGILYSKKVKDKKRRDLHGKTF